MGAYCHKSEIMEIPHVDSLECPICAEDIVYPYRTKSLDCDCNPRRIYHRRCINRWLLQKPTCPMCRKVINMRVPLRRDIVNNLNAEQFIYSITHDIFDMIITNWRDDDIIVIFSKFLHQDIVLDIINQIKNYIHSSKFSDDIENDKISLVIDFRRSMNRYYN